MNVFFSHFNPPYFSAATTTTLTQLPTHTTKMSLMLQIQLQGWRNNAALVVRLIKADIMWIDARQSSLDARVQSLIGFSRLCLQYGLIGRIKVPQGHYGLP